ncbi:dTDP-4-dehydrorhamnose reductase [Flavobacterium sp.]|uniref:dTDP-4-dehydrorhamnose reductase n=1 Tax=Flavobacterium sp. TaxID=239 RepID=UPI002636A0C2|nr:dTDP-4-dehydrorhamnose reductase [Flavobacterium sp.]
MVVVVVGANGQLGQAVHYIASDYPEIQFHFLGSTALDIAKIEDIKSVWKALKPDFCINAAAYTATDKAETEIEKAQSINVDGAKNLAEVCLLFNTTLLHISTDFVFDGNKKTPYLETDAADPQSVYGKTKREGELAIIKTMKTYFIIRTSWLYSQFGNNFMKTMLRLAQERSSLSVVDDQIGTPTHAVDLAKMLLTIIKSNSKNYGIYHFSNQGNTSWYGFAKKIFEVNHVSIALSPITTAQYPTPAKRPEYSVLDKSKIEKTFKQTIKNWDIALEQYTNEI